MMTWSLALHVEVRISHHVIKSIAIISPWTCHLNNGQIQWMWHVFGLANSPLQPYRSNLYELSLAILAFKFGGWTPYDSTLFFLNHMPELARNGTIVFSSSVLPGSVYLPEKGQYYLDGKGIIILQRKLIIINQSV